jgi:Kef-type K+ transport system membrane component KefB
VLEALLHSPFGEIATLLVIAAVVGFVGLLLHQPLIVSFIVVGLIAGPSALDLVRSSEQIDLLSELGIVVLLFLVGIKLDVKLVRSLGAVSLLTGLGQVLFTSVIGYGIGLLLGLGSTASLYVAVALTFSSTIIIVKLLSDKREIDSLHGQIALGFLIVQDIVVVLAMIVLSTVGIGAGNESSLTEVLGIGVALMGAVALIVRYVADPLTERLARSPELLLVYAIAQATILASVCEVAGLGKEVGGLLAGISLASTPYRETISARLAPLRDFLLLFFFIALGAKLDLSLLGAEIGAAAVFSLFVLVGNPLIVLAIMGAMGYRKRTSFLAGLTVAQISEFSLIFIAMGVTLGHVGDNVLGLVTLVGLVTIAASTYMITYSHRLYGWFEPWLGPFERRHGTVEATPDAASQTDAAPTVIVFGLGRYGTAIGERLSAHGVDVLGVDFNPEVVREWRSRGLDACYGDITDAEFIASLPLPETKFAISTIPVHALGLSYDDARRTLVQALEAGGFRGRKFMAAHGTQDQGTGAGPGVDLLLQPFEDAADRVVERILPELR